MEEAIRELIDISQYAGARADYTQGGGGNTSVKDEKKNIMFIKASGYRLVDINENTAYVPVDQKKILNYYNSVDLSVKKDYEKESAEVSKSATLVVSGMPALRPSVEVGFHAILKKYVIHTHSVYANLLTCSNEGEEIAKKLFKDKDFGFIFLPYINPGFELTLAMKDKIGAYIKEYNRYPEVIFMKNHGLVVNSDYIKRVKAVNTDVNETIRKYFGLEDNFREIALIEENGAFKSKTDIVLNYVKKNPLNIETLDKAPLYPDQLVYLNNLLRFNPDQMKVVDGEVIYNVDAKKARTLEETLAAYLFVISNVEKNKLTLSTMNEKEVDFINNWEAEKYRRSVK